MLVTGVNYYKSPQKKMSNLN